MAMSSDSYAASKKDNILDISAEEYYFNTLRPYLQSMLLKCRTDGELIRTIDKVINAADSFCVRKKYALMAESFDVLETGITDKSYFNGVMKKAPEEEKEMVRNLVGKISDLRMIIQCEEPTEEEPPSFKERINYEPPTALSPNGENKDYQTHNMKNLTACHPNKRIPNV